MEWQTILNFFLGTLSALLGWFGRELWGAVKELRKDLFDLRQNLNDNYVRRDDYKDFKQDIMDMLHRIEDKLDKKSDKTTT